MEVRNEKTGEVRGVFFWLKRPKRIFCLVRFIVAVFGDFFRVGKIRSTNRRTTRKLRFASTWIWVKRTGLMNLGVIHGI